MMRVKQSTGQRMAASEIKQDLPHLSFADESDLSEFGYPTLEPIAQPDPIDADHRVIAGPDEEYEPGKWRQTWVQEPIPEPPVPQEITTLQALLAIDQLGYAAQYQAWSTDPARTFVERAFIDKATVWRRGDAMFNAAADALGFTGADKDNFFRLADTL
jgi:hypothetical protein